MDFRVGTRLVTTDGSELLAYPKTCAAYAKLTRLLTLGKRRADKGVCQLDLSDILAGLADTVLTLKQPVRSQAHIPALQETFGDDLYLGLAPHYDGWDEDRFQIVSDLADHHTLPLVALGNVLMHASRRRMLADVLSSIRLKCTVDELGQHAQLNAERRLRSEFEMRKMFARYPDAIRNTLWIADACTFRLSELSYEYPDEVLNGVDPDTRLRQLTEKGLTWRYPGGVPLRVRALVEKELGLIAKLAYAPYLLTVQDIVSFARDCGILCQGRGSAASSVVYAIIRPGPIQGDMVHP